MNQSRRADGGACISPWGRGRNLDSRGEMRPYSRSARSRGGDWIIGTGIAVPGRGIWVIWAKNHFHRSLSRAPARVELILGPHSGRHHALLHFQPLRWSNNHDHRTVHRSPAGAIGETCRMALLAPRWRRCAALPGGSKLLDCFSKEGRQYILKAPPDNLSNVTGRG